MPKGSNHTTHGLSGTRAYARWKAARQRCNDPNAQNYKHYGGRGIRMAPAWDDFAVFYAEMGECPPFFTLDRIDPERGYEPGNCRWASQAEQVRNFRTRNIFVQHEGRRMVLKDYVRLFGVTYNGVRWRINNLGETPAEAVAKLLERQRRLRSKALEASASR